MDYTKTYDKGLIPVKKLPKDLAERFEDLRIFSKHMPVMERRFFIEKLVELERTYKEDTEIKTIKCFNHIVNRWQKSITLGYNTIDAETLDVMVDVKKN